MYILDGTTIRSPGSIKESNSTLVAQNRVLNGSVSRDYFGSNKRVWVLDYTNVQKTSYDTIKTIYDSYLSTATAKTWEITETNYTISSTNVHIDLLERGFSVKGEDYISDFTLILTES
jgi:hypothetical protein